MAARIHGITVTLLERAQVGVDEFRRPVYDETPLEIENVLVGQPTTDELTDTLNLTGKRVAYVMALPKGDAHEWENRRVMLPEPFAGTYQTIGFPTAGIEENIPLAWNKKVKLERIGD